MNLSFKVLTFFTTFVITYYHYSIDIFSVDASILHLTSKSKEKYFLTATTCQRMLLSSVYL